MVVVMSETVVELVIVVIVKMFSVAVVEVTLASKAKLGNFYE